MRAGRRNRREEKSLLGDGGEDLEGHPGVMLILAVRGAVPYAPEEEKSARPLLLVAVEGDRRMPPFIARQLCELSANLEKRLLILPGTRRGEAFNRRSESTGRRWPNSWRKFAPGVRPKVAGQPRNLPRKRKTQAPKGTEFARIGFCHGSGPLGGSHGDERLIGKGGNSMMRSRACNRLVIGGLIVGLTLCISACSTPETVTKPKPPSPAERASRNEISQHRLLARIKLLSSDEFEGRAPASQGEERTISFLETEFREAGLKPGNPDGSYFQKVPMVGITADPNMRLVFGDPASGEKRALKYGSDFVAWTKRVAPEAAIDSELVFVGYGVVAPEFQWDDYKGVDVKGKVLVVLVNDPPVPDERVFGGKAMTYYGRWTYKYEIAAAKGAAGCLVIHETGPAGYPWAVVEGSNRGEQFDLLRKDKGMSRVAVEGWMTFEQAKALFAMTGKDLLELKKAAVERSFKPVPLGVKASVTIHNKIRTIESNNVIAKLEGSDAKLRDEYLIYMAHWDHLGMGQELQGDKIYNGAKDNASGTAALLELADAYAKVQPPPRRSVLFLAVTAEEQGLLGSEYYAQQPLYPLVKTVAVINMDALNVLGPTKDIIVIGLGNSTLDDYVKEVGTEQGRVVKPDPEPEKGFYYRSDHFNFAKQGVPALDPKDGVDFIGKPAGWGLEMRKKYTAEDYHKPSDEVKPYWDLSGLVEDLRLLFSVGYRVANADQIPAWSPGTEFKAKREAMLKTASSHR